MIQAELLYEYVHGPSTHSTEAASAPAHGPLERARDTTLAGHALLCCQGAGDPTRFSGERDDDEEPERGTAAG